MQVADTRRTSGTTYSAIQADGSPLPEGVTVDPSTGRVTGSLPEGQQSLQIRITAQDVDGTTRTIQVTVEREGGESAPLDQAAAYEGMTPFSDQLAKAVDRDMAYGDRLVAALDGAA